MNKNVLKIYLKFESDEREFVCPAVLLLAGSGSHRCYYVTSMMIRLFDPSKSWNCNLTTSRSNGKCHWYCSITSPSTCLPFVYVFMIILIYHPTVHLLFGRLLTTISSNYDVYRWTQWPLGPAPLGALSLVKQTT